MPIGVMLPNDADVVAALFGVWRLGGVYVPLNPRLGGSTSPTSSTPSNPPSSSRRRSTSTASATDR